MSDDNPKPIKTRMAHSLEFKTAVLDARREHAEKPSRFIAKKFNIDESLVRKWEKYESQIRNAPTSSNRKHLVRKRVPMFPEVDEAVLEWIRDQNAKDIHVGIKAIKQYAAGIRDELIASGAIEGDRLEALKKFQCSQVWIQKFKDRSNLKLRKNAPQLPENTQNHQEDEDDFPIDFIKVEAEDFYYEDCEGSYEDYEEENLSNHQEKCRFCIGGLEDSIEITEKISKMFEEVTSTHLDKSPVFSNKICTSCYYEIENLSQVRRNLIETQQKLVNHVEEESRATIEEEKDETPVIQYESTDVSSRVQNKKNNKAFKKPVVVDKIAKIYAESIRDKMIARGLIEGERLEALKNFQFSNAWIQKFKDRSKVMTHHKKETVTQPDEDDFLMEFLKFENEGFSCDDSDVTRNSNKKFANHQKKCRFCVTDFQNSEDCSEITEETSRKFGEVTSTHLDSSPAFSHKTCTDCSYNIDNLSLSRLKLIETQEKLAKYVEMMSCAFIKEESDTDTVMQCEVMGDLVPEGNEETEDGTAENFDDTEMDKHVSSKSNKIRKSIPLSFKIKVLDARRAEPFTSRRKIAQRFGVLESMLRDWEKIEDKLRSTPEGNLGKRRHIPHKGIPRSQWKSKP